MSHEDKTKRRELCWTSDISRVSELGPLLNTIIQPAIVMMPPACHVFSPFSTQVRVTLTNEANKIFKALQVVQPKGAVNFITGIRIAHVRS